ncbi:MAG: phosphatase PAP2 family protein [Anaerolineales bacterium]|nr:phosphatase PAP2 family protein [Anaerolineales bacterium]
MTFGKRLLWLSILFLSQALYFPINRMMTGGRLLETRWDALIPLWPIFALPYLLSLAWWAGCFIWASLKMEANLYRAFVAGVLFTMLTSYAFYILYPTYVTRPEVAGVGWQYNLLRWIYTSDRLNNAFPSGHTYITMLIVFFWWNWRPRLRCLWAAIAAVIILSTLFTGQHNLPDPLGGVLWAWAGYRFGLWWAGRGARQ